MTDWINVYFRCCEVLVSLCGLCVGLYCFLLCIDKLATRILQYKGMWPYVMEGIRKYADKESKEGQSA